MGDLVEVRGLTNRVEYNGHPAIVKTLILSNPDNKCQVGVLKKTNGRPTYVEGKQLLLKTRCLRVILRAEVLASVHVWSTGKTALLPEEATVAASLPLALPETEEATVAASLPLALPETVQRCKKMKWGSTEHEALQRRMRYEEDWQQTVDSMDPCWFVASYKNVYLYLVKKIASLIRRNNKIGLGWHFASRKVKDLHYGCVWGFGGKEQEEPLTADIYASGSQWWPVIWVYCPDHEKWPVYCPGLAWQNARPWWAHPSRIREVETPRVINEELDEDWNVVDVL